MGVRRIQITLSEQVAERLASKARDYGRSDAELAAEAIDAFLEEDDYLSAVNEGLAQADAGLLIDNEEMRKWVESQATANPLPIPKPKRR
jgi:predicted transcriptional regulator